MAEGRPYHVTYERGDAGGWEARVLESGLCRAWGWTIDQARRHICEFLAVPPESLAEDIHLPKRARILVQRYFETKDRAALEQARAKDALLTATRHLTLGMGLGVRDAALVLRLSHQRVQQIARFA